MRTSSPAERNRTSFLELINLVLSIVGCITTACEALETFSPLRKNVVSKIFAE